MCFRRASLLLAVTLFVLPVAGCGSDGATRTVVQTVATTAPAEPAPAATTSSDAPADAAAPAASAPVSGLPSGAVAIQGRFQMKVVKFANTTSVDPGEAIVGPTRLWVAKMTCVSGRCEVDLRRELATGGFDTTVLKQNGSDPRSFGATETPGTKYCFRSAEGPATTRVSVRVSGVESIGGQRRAKRLDGYFLAKQRCRVGQAGRGSVMYRGALDSAP